MKKKYLLATAIGLVLLGAVIGAALNAVFTVTDVKVNFTVLSEQGAEDAVVLQEKLEDLFIGKSTTFVKLEEMDPVMAAYPAFKLEKAEKEFPRTVTVAVTERKEAFAFRRADNGLFAVLDEEGRYLYDKSTNENRRKGENILFDGFVFADTQPGEVVRGDFFEAALAFADVFWDELGDARANIESISLIDTGNPVEKDCFLRIRMREGVCMEVYDPKSYTTEKAEDMLRKYLSLTDAQRMYGFFDVMDLLDPSDAERPYTVSEHHEQSSFRA